MYFSGPGAIADDTKPNRDLGGEIEILIGEDTQLEGEMKEKKAVPINSAKALTVACCSTVVGAQVFCLLPIILGTIADHLTINAAQTGVFAAIYFGGFTSTTIISALWVRRFRWQHISPSGVLLVITGFLPEVERIYLAIKRVGFSSRKTISQDQWKKAPC